MSRWKLRSPSCKSLAPSIWWLTGHRSSCSCTQIQTGSLRFIHLFLLSLFFCCQTTLMKPLKQKTIVFCMNYSAFGGSPAEHSWQWSDKHLKTCSQIKMALNLTSDQWLTVYKHVKLQILSWGWCQWERHRVVEIKKKGLPSWNNECSYHFLLIN